MLKTVLTSTAAAAALLAPLAPAHSAPQAAPLATSTLRPTKIRLTLTPETLGIGERLRIQGVGYRTDTYSPIVDRTVYIQSRPAWTTRPWRTTTTVRTNAYGQFTYVRTVDRSRQYRAVISATTRDAKAVSKAEINRATPGVWTNVSAHVSRTTTGRPAASASMAASPNPSLTDGNANTLLAATSAGRSSSATGPSTVGVMPNSRWRRSKFARYSR